MKKLFSALSFILCFFCFVSVRADVISVDEAELQNAEPKPLIIEPIEGMPDPNNLDEVLDFFKKRFQTAVVSSADELGDLNKSSTMGIQHSEEYIKQIEESQKSDFEKIYEHALERIDAPDPEFSPDTVFYERVKNAPQSGDVREIDFPVVNVRLPNGQVVLAPAREHIPYLLSSYHILPTGSIEVDEEVIVIANGNVLKDGLVKRLHKSTTSRSKVKKKLDITLISVSVNGREIPYKLKEIGNNIFFVPKENYHIESGVYTYRFKYLVDRKLWYYGDFTEFYANVTEGYQNLVVASANAIVSVPDGKTFTSQTALAGYPDKLSTGRTVIARLGENALGFASILPLNVGEGMHILVSLDKDVFVNPGFGRRFVWFVTDYGDILFALLGFIMIYGSYFLSWQEMKRNKSQVLSHGKDVSAFNRYILNGVYDKRSFVALLLDLLRYRVIDIQKEGGFPILVKKTDRLKGLPRVAKIIVQTLFGKSDTVFEVHPKNVLKFKRAFAKSAKNVKNHFRLSAWRFNLTYLGFGSMMLLLTIFAISYISINPLEMFLIIFLSILTLSFYMWVFKKSYRSRIKGYIFKTLAAFFIMVNILILSVYVHFICAVLLAGTVYLMLEFLHMFAKKNNILKEGQMSLEKLKDYLEKEALQISLGQEFDFQQANIFAFELEEKYEKTQKNEKQYRLDIAREILGIL